MKCPWCEEYLKYYDKEFGVLSKKDIEREKNRINKGFWAQIKNVNKMWQQANMAYTIEEAIAMRQPVHINMKTGDAWFGRFWFFTLAEKRDVVLNKDLEHYWILSGGCSMSWNTPMCCEMANCTSIDEALNWEIREFSDLKNENNKIIHLIE